MKREIKVSVIIPIYNGETDLPDLIECLRSQTYPREQVEYILVNNNSSDKTEKIIETAATEALTQGLTIQSLSENNIQSAYAARNTGIRFSQGDIVAFTDADCRPQPDWLEQLVQPFVNSKIAVVVGELVALPGKTVLEKYAEVTHLMSQSFLINHPFCSYGQTANLAIRKQAFEEVGLFRPHLTTGGDADMCWRILRDKNWQLEYVSKAIVRHRHRDNWRDFKSQWQRYGRSNRYLHELYGVDLMRELTIQESFYRLSRWLLKELPRDSIKVIFGKASPVALMKTPINLIGFQSRTIGQKEAKLPEEAKKIEWL
ncbi:MAG: glycosyltransferase [Microcystaceae cyanobacterium]